MSKRRENKSWTSSEFLALCVLVGRVSSRDGTLISWKQVALSKERERERKKERETW
jgi:hypothetical protein